MKKNEKKRIILEGDQKKYQEDFSFDIENRNKLSPRIRKISSSPGSGKTTLIEESLRSFIEENEKIVDEMIDNEEKILVLVFNKTNKKELETRFKKAEFPMDLFEITTINSLFFRHAKSLTEIKEDTGVLGTFKVDYTKSTFSHEMIKEILKTFIKGEKFKSSTGEAEKELFEKTRLFSEEILSVNNIENIWALVNTYYSSSYNINEWDKIEEKSSFFGRNGGKLESIELAKEEEDMLARNNQMPHTNFMKLIIKRIEQMANYRETIREVYTVEEEISVPIYVEEVIDGEIVEIEHLNTQVVEKKKVKEKKENIIKVPHAYYYKEMIQLMVQNKSLMKKIFGKYKIVMVDEAQDNPRSFLEFGLKALIDGVFVSLSVIGDSLQGIYAFSSPDNFDLLRFCEENKEKLENGGIKVEEYDLHQTHRFGEAIAQYTNDLFSGSKIIGKKDIDDFIYPETLSKEDFVEKVKKASEYGTTAIVCRTNNESAEMFIRMKEGGHENVRLESSAKKELSDFAKNGIDAISDKHHRKILTNIINKFRREHPNFKPKNEKIKKYEEILASKKAVEFLRGAGYAKLVQFNIDQVEKYIVPAQRGKSKATVIGNSWQLKGQEFDTVFISNGYLKKEIGDQEETINMSEYDDYDFSDNSSIVMEELEVGGLDLSDFEEQKEKTTKEKKEIKTEKKNGQDEGAEYKEELSLDFTKKNIQDILENPETGQEKAVLFVAVTRAKKGVFFEDGIFGRAMLSQFCLNSEEMKYRGDKFLNGGKDPIESLLEQEEKTKQEMGLFSFK